MALCGDGDFRRGIQRVVWGGWTPAVTPTVPGAALPGHNEGRGRASSGLHNGTESRGKA